MRGLLLAIGFLTRLPVPALKDFTPGELGDSAPWFPVAGLLVGAVVTAALWLGCRVDATLGALFGVLAWVVVTGALHLDGLADTCDALGAAHRDRARFLAVLADPHLGVFGVVSVVLQLLAKFVLLLELAQRGLWFGVMLAPVWARWGVLWWARLPSIKPGLGERFAWRVGRAGVAAWALALGAVSLLVQPMLCMLVIWAWGWRQFMLHRLGGMTGDLLGAGVELLESAALLTLMAAWSVAA